MVVSVNLPTICSFYPEIRDVILFKVANYDFGQMWNSSDKNNYYLGIIKDKILNFDLKII